MTIEIILGVLIAIYVFVAFRAFKVLGRLDKTICEMERMIEKEPKKE
jgi:hypothetical protein